MGREGKERRRDERDREEGEKERRGNWNRAAISLKPGPVEMSEEMPRSRTG